MSDSLTCKKASHVCSHIYLGSANDAKNLKWLKDTNIRYILNCTPSKTVDPIAGTPNYFQKDSKFIYKRIPIFDNQGEDILQYMDVSYRFIEESQYYGNILVHCHRGISRSASFIIGYLMKKNEFTRDEALSYIQTIRPIVQPNSTFMSQLLVYEGQLLSLRSEDTEVTNKSSIISLGPDINATALLGHTELDVVLAKDSDVIDGHAVSILGKRDREVVGEE